MNALAKKQLTYLLILGLISCARGPQDEAFQQLLDRYQREHYQLNPIPDLSEDSGKLLLTIPDEIYLQKEKAFCKRYHKALKAFDVQRLNAENQESYQSLYQQYSDCAGLQKDENPWYWDASRYDIGPAVQSALKIAEKEARLEALFNSLVQTPAYYEAAKQNLQHPDVNKLQLAIRFNRASFFYLNNEVSQYLIKAGLPDDRLRPLQVKLHYAKLAIKDYIAFCNSMLFEYSEPDSDIRFKDDKASAR